MKGIISVTRTQSSLIQGEEAEVSVEHIEIVSKSLAMTIRYPTTSASIASSNSSGG